MRNADQNSAMPAATFETSAIIAVSRLRPKATAEKVASSTTTE
jgi:hypothetical protein